MTRAQLGWALGPQSPSKHVSYECKNSLDVLSQPSSVQQMNRLGIVIKMIPILCRVSWDFLHVILGLPEVLQWAGTGLHLGRIGN